MWANLVAAVLPKLLDWITKNLGSVAAWFWSKYKQGAMVRKEKREVTKELKRVQEAMDKAFDGEPILPEEKRELINAFRELIRDY